MDILLKNEEVRVLGSLLEKKMSTPDYYPLSLNSLISACNQKASRNPVVTYGDTTILRALETLKRHKLAWQNAQGRVSKYKEGLVDTFRLSEEEAAVMCVLMLRGAQTIGEIRGRTERLYSFGSLEDVNHVLTKLGERDFVMILPRQPGQKEARYTHLLSEQPQAAEEQAAEAPVAASADRERIDKLEKQVESLSEELQELKQAFVEFQRQFE